MNFNEYKKRALANDPKLNEEYKRLEPEYEIIRQVITARAEQNLSQADLAKRVGIKQSNISRLESGNYNPSLDFLRKIASGLGKELHVELR
ncbi:MAG: helix-turn-helix transcriptional regulator [Oscillospiraceae bacterium]|nr:helix-turn-helix transcriptional regulator [Oscillospiraceae bacterium]MDD4592880.1 helix-turn-helix transcriptional regulator [Parabacteroides sp.]